MTAGLVPAKGVLAFFDPILHVTPAVVGLDHLGLGQTGVGHDETDPGEELPGVPFDLADHPARLGPTFSLVTEINDLDLDAAFGRPADRSPKMRFD